MQDPLKIGIVGCDEGTHGKVWAELLASEGGARFGMKPVRIWDRSPEAARTLARAVGAEAVADAADAGKGVDGVMITELMPDRYRELAAPFLERGMRVFFNRPFAGSVADAHAIVKMAARHGAKVYSASALYHTQTAARALEQLDKIKPLRLFSVTGPTDHLVFYLPHAVAAMVSVLGTGVATVRALSLKTGADDPARATGPVVVYVEYASDAPIGPARGVIQMIGPGATWYGFSMTMFGAGGEAEPIRFEVTYDHLLETMARFFRTGEEPVPLKTIVEKTCIYHAAIASARRGYTPIDVARLTRPEGR